MVTMPMSVRQGINAFLAGWIPSENMRFREEELNFQVKENVDGLKQQANPDGVDDKAKNVFTYPSMSKTLGPFKLTVEGGTFKPSEIIMMLGQNGTGKTTLIKIIAGI